LQVPYVLSEKWDVHMIHCSAVVQARPKPTTTKPNASPGVKKIRLPKPPPTDKPYVPPPSTSVRGVSPSMVAKIFHGMSVKQLADQLGQTVESVQGSLVGLGELVNHPTDAVKIDAAELVAYVSHYCGEICILMFILNVPY
jgi:hypothetical protein